MGRAIRLKTAVCASYIEAAEYGPSPPESSMIRVLAIVLIVLVAWLLLAKLSREIRKGSIDWKGWAIFVGFIALAFYLSHVTGIG